MSYSDSGAWVIYIYIMSYSELGARVEVGELFTKIFTV